MARTGGTNLEIGDFTAKALRRYVSAKKMQGQESQILNFNRSCRLGVAKAGGANLEIGDFTAKAQRR